MSHDGAGGLRRSSTLPPTDDQAALSAGSPWLSAFLFLTLSIAPLEGYLQTLQPSLSKVPAALLILAWVFHLARRRRLPSLHLISWLAGALMLIVAVSSAVNTEQDVVLAFSVRWGSYLILLIALIDILTNAVDIRLAVAAIVAGAVVSAGGACYSFVVLHNDRATGPLADPNDLAYVLVAAAPFVLLAPTPPSSRWVRAAQLCCTFLIAVGIAATLSRGAVVAAVVGLTWGFARRLISLRAVAAGVLMAVAGAAAIWAVAAPTVQTALAQKSYIAQSNIDNRELRWEAAARLVREHPLTGVGPGATRTEYVAASNNADLVDQRPATHNMYLEVGAELGMPGLIVFVAMIVLALGCTERVMHSRQRHLGLATQASLLTICVASTFLSEEYYTALWAAIAIGAALQLRHRRGHSPG